MVGERCAWMAEGGAHGWREGAHECAPYGPVHMSRSPPTRGVWCAFMRTGGPPKNHPADPRRRVRIHAPPDTLQSPSFAVTISFTAFVFALPPVAFIT